MARKSVYSLIDKSPMSLACFVGVTALVGNQTALIFFDAPGLPDVSAFWPQLCGAAISAMICGAAWRISLSSTNIEGRSETSNEAISSLPLNQMSTLLSRRLPLGVLPSEHLLAAIATDIEGGCEATVLATIELKDFERLYAFDVSAAKNVLNSFAARLDKVLGHQYPASHLDRGIFGLWLSGCEPNKANGALKTIAYALRAEIQVAESAILPEVSLKIGIYPQDGGDAETLLTTTLISGREFEAVKEEKSRKNGDRQRYSLEQGLRHAVERRELALQFQPIVDLQRGRIDGAEALIRWEHPTLGQISPSIFVPLLEEMGLIHEIGLWSLNAACGALRTWIDSDLSHLSVSMNLSAKQLQEPTLVAAVERTLERHQVPAGSLTLELTETAAMHDADRTVTLFGELKGIGVSLAVDDFGTGYSSLSYLLKLPFDKLKIDREFVIDVDRNPQRSAICRSLVELANGLQIDLVAEGAETAAEVNALEEIGCRFVQGFHFSKPVSNAHFRTLATQPQWNVARSEAPVERIAGARR